MRRGPFTLAVALLAVVAIAIPVLAVTKGGVPDDGDHPMVGLSVYFAFEDHDADVGTAEILVVQHRCSGTLLSPTVYLTAGHCTDGMDKAMMWFEPDVQAGQAAGTNGYPDFDVEADLYHPAWGEAGFTYDGTPHTYPLYEAPLPWFMADLGVVVLDGTGVPASVTTAFGELPDDLEFDNLKRGRKTTFTAVGYGTQFTTGTYTPAIGWTPSPDVSLKVRLRANPWLLQVNTPGFTGDFSFLLSNNAATGGTCFGDSGGPNFFEDSLVVAGVTSYGLNGSCGGTGGVFRMDHDLLIDWVEGFLP